MDANVKWYSTKYESDLTQIEKDQISTKKTQPLNPGGTGLKKKPARVVLMTHLSRLYFHSSWRKLPSPSTFTQNICSGIM